VHLVGFFTNKFVTMHGHMNVTEHVRPKTSLDACCPINQRGRNFKLLGIVTN